MYRRDFRQKKINLDFVAEKSASYSSFSQKARILTEDWVGREIYCPSCGSFVKRADNNTPVLDFTCPNCFEGFELKSKKERIASKVVDGAYQTMMERLQSDNNPSLFLLTYHPIDLQVLDFLVIPKHFFNPQIIEKRKPLSKDARRAGWVGCNILINHIPSSGRIFMIKNRIIEPKANVLDAWGKTMFLREEKNAESKGWLLDIMMCIDELNKTEFSLQEVYAFEGLLKVKHPGNRHIKDKIRQQLQVLRDNGYLKFLGRGQYRKIVTGGKHAAI